MNRKKPHVKIVILGNVDSGKTTLAGHLIYKYGIIDRRIFDQFEKEAIEMGKKSFKYLLIYDRLMRKRELGTIADIPSCQFETNKNYITLMDSPRYRDYINSLMTSISLANCALLLMPASVGEFEASISKHSSTHKHVSIVYAMGIKQMIVLVNKMDTTDPPYSEERFNEIKTEVLLHLKKIGYQPEHIIFIPISAWVGDNLAEPSTNMSWFQGQTIHSEEGTMTYRTLLDVLDSIILPPPPIDKPLRLILDAIYKTNNAKTILIGCVETGILRPGMTIRFTPSNLSAQVKTIQMHNETLDEAFPGDQLVCTVNDIDTDEIRSGCVCSDVANDPAEEAAYFIAQISILHYCKRIIQGHRCIIHCHMAQITCEIDELLERIDQKSGQTIEKNPPFIKSGDTALIKIIPLDLISVEKDSDYPSLSRFVMFDDEWMMAAGVIKHVEKKNRLII